MTPHCKTYAQIVRLLMPFYMRSKEWIVKLKKEKKKINASFLNLQIITKFLVFIGHNHLSSSAGISSPVVGLVYKSVDMSNSARCMDLFDCRVIYNDMFMPLKFLETAKGVIHPNCFTKKEANICLSRWLGIKIYLK